MNATTRAILANLHRNCPGAELVTPQEIADAYGMRSANAVLQDIRTGKLHANRIHSRTFISIEAAERYIIGNEVVPDEGELPGQGRLPL